MMRRAAAVGVIAALALGCWLTACFGADEYLPHPSGSTVSTPSQSPDEPARTWAPAAGTGSRNTAAGNAEGSGGAADSVGATGANGESPGVQPHRRHRVHRRETSASAEAVVSPTGAEESPGARVRIEEVTASGEPIGRREDSLGERPAAALFGEQPKEAAREAAGDPRRESAGAMAGMLVGLGLKLGLVIILAYLCALAVRKVGQRRGALRIGSGVLRVVESAALAPNRGLHIVAVGKRAFLVGSTPEQFSVLGEVSDVAEVSRLTEAQESTGTLAGRLRQWLGREPRGGRAASRDPLIERMQAGAESLRGLATHSTPRFDNALQAAIDDAHRR